MPNHVLLDNVSHKDLKIITDKSEKYGDNLASVLTFPYEFRNIQTHYPICFKKDEEGGEFYCAALLGFEENENLFLNENGWDASYIPLMIERQPFLIGIRSAQDGEEQQVIHVDMDSPRVSQTEGEPVFLQFGGSSAYLERMSNILAAIDQGQRYTPKFINALIKYELLEPFTLDVELVDGSKHKLVDFYTVREDTLQNLPANVLAELSQMGILQQAYMVLASQSNFATLIRKKNQKIQRASL